MATIVYFHGFASAPGGEKLDALRAAFPEHHVVSPALDADPEQALQKIMRTLYDFNGDKLVVGTSLGGFWAYFVSRVFDVPAVLVNPSLEPSRALRKYLNRTVYNYITGEPVTVHDANLEQYARYEDLIKSQLCFDYSSDLPPVDVCAALDDDVVNTRVLPELLDPGCTLYYTETGGHRYTSQWSRVIDRVRARLADARPEKRDLRRGFVR